MLLDVRHLGGSSFAGFVGHLYRVLGLACRCEVCIAGRLSLGWRLKYNISCRIVQGTFAAVSRIYDEGSAATSFESSLAI